MWIGSFFSGVEGGVLKVKPFPSYGLKNLNFFEKPFSSPANFKNFAEEPPGRFFEVEVGVTRHIMVEIGM